MIHRDTMGHGISIFGCGDMVGYFECTYRIVWQNSFRGTRSCQRPFPAPERTPLDHWRTKVFRNSTRLPDPTERDLFALPADRLKQTRLFRLDAGLVCTHTHDIHLLIDTVDTRRYNRHGRVVSITVV